MGGDYMAYLRGKVALVTSASRSVGRGGALGLGESGATVYITGASVFAAPLMIELEAGLIVNISFIAAQDDKGK
jgi:hypothetical protein